jgi:hypothetical protein
MRHSCAIQAQDRRLSWVPAADLQGAHPLNDLGPDVWGGRTAAPIMKRRLLPVLLRHLNALHNRPRRPALVVPSTTPSSGPPSRVATLGSGLDQVFGVSGAIRKRIW